MKGSEHVSTLGRIAQHFGIIAGSAAIALVAPATAVAGTIADTGSTTVHAVAQPGGGHYPILLTEMSINAGYAFFPAGQVTFDVKNAGTVTHELVVIRTDVVPSAIPLRATDKTKADETGSLGELEDLAPGATASLTLDLKPGRYALICNEPGHFAAGMRAGFTAATFVGVTLKEMLIGLDSAVVPAGPVVFSASNAGTTTHELVVLKTELAADKIPARATDPTKADETGDVGEIEDIDAARFSGGVFDLAAGKYVLICNEPGHYAAGMRIAFTVQ